MKKTNINFWVQAAMIAASYIALTYISNLFNLAYGGIQFRLSEALTLLPILTPAAIPGLAVGCFLSNLASPYGIIDWVFGTIATLVACLLTRAFRNIRIKKLPVLSALMPVIANGIIIGAEISFLMPEGFTLLNMLIFGGQVALGELAVCFALGIPLTISLEKTKILK